MGVSGGFGSFVGSMFATKRRRAAAAMILAALLLSIVVFFVLNAASAATSRSITALGTANTENFDGLATTGTSNVLPSGFAVSETGTSALADGNYTANNGSNNAGDTYSYGPASGGADRALGSLRTSTLASVFGASFTNNTGAPISSLDISYVGEQWRLGAVGRTSTPPTDALNFSYSTNATSLANGTYIPVPALHFSSPTTAGALGPLNGNDAANRTEKTATISNLSLEPGDTFFIRWTDEDATGADDGLAADNLSFTAFASDLTVCASGCNFTTIQGAVNGAAPGATITVEDGAYSESVDVNKANLTIKGAQFGADPSGANPRSGGESVVDSPDADAPFNVSADGVTIDGFTIMGSETGGIVTGSSTSGASISNNIIESNAVGIVARSDGASEIMDNLIQNNNEAGTSSGTGILSDGLQNVAIGGNRLAGHDAFAMSLGNSSGQNNGIQITDNAIPSSGTSSGGGISLSDTDNSSITGNSITDVSNSGVFFVGSVNGVTIENNEISGSGTSGIRIPETVNTNSGISILGNTLMGNDYGIRFDDNTVGDELEIHENRIVGNTTNGIRGNDTNGEPRVDAENNWWGCNEGPLSAASNGCDSISAILPSFVDSNLHLTLEADAVPATIKNDGGESTITASLEDGSSATAANFPNTSISFVSTDTHSGTATNPSALDPNPADTMMGAANTTLTSGSRGTVNVSATLDNETVDTNVLVNETPVAVADEYSVDEDETLTADDLDGTAEDPNGSNNDSVLFNDTDSDGDTLTVADGDDTDTDTDEPGEVDPASGPSEGMLTLRADGSFDYDPDDDFNGTDSFTYRATDGTSESEEATVEITVHPVNDAPVAEDASRQTAEDGDDVFVNLAEASVDPDATTPAPLVSDVETANANLEYELVGTVPDGATLSGSILTYDPASNFNTGDPATPVGIEYSVTDRGDPDACTDGANPGDNETNTDACDSVQKDDTGTISVTVEPRNNAPSFEVGEDQTVAENSENPPNENSERFHVVEGFLTDISPGPADEIEQTVTFSTSTVNDALFDEQPTITPSNSANPGDLTYQLKEDANGTATITVVATDNGADTNTGDDNVSDPQTFTITVTPENAAPVADNGEEEMLEHEPNQDNLTIDFTALVTDDETDPDDMTYEITGGLTDATTGMDGVITGDEGTLTPAWSMDDLEVVPGQFVFDPTNDFNTGEDTVAPLDITFTATDRGDPDDCDEQSPPAQGCAEPLTSEPGTVEVTIHPVNDAPTADNDTADTNEDVPVVIDVLEGDSPGPANESDQTLAVDEAHLAMTANQPANGEAVVITQAMIDEDADDDFTQDTLGDILYSPDPDYNNDSTTPDTFTYQACDNGKSYDLGDTNTLIDDFMCDGADVSVTVTAVNDAPTLTLDDPANQEVAENSMSGTETRTHTVPSFASGDPGGGEDEDGQAVTFEAVVVDGDGDPISGGSPLFATQPAIANDGTLTYTLAENENGMANIRVVAIDDGTPPASSDPETFTITVAPENSRPTSDNVPASEATTDEGTPLEINLNGKVADIETADEDLIYAFTGLGGTVTGDLDGDGISGDEGTISRKLDENGDPVPGVFIFTPEDNFNTGAGTLDISYTVADLGDPEDCDTANPNAEPHPQGCDGPLASDPAGTISIDVTPVNTAPEARDAERTLVEDGDILTMNLTNEEVDPDATNPAPLVSDVEVDNTDNLDYEYVEDSLTNETSSTNGSVTTYEGDEGTVTVEGASITFEPADDFNTDGSPPVELGYKVTDRGDPDDCDDTDPDNTIDNCDGPASDTGTISVAITAVNDPPVVRDTERTMDEDGVLSFNVFTDNVDPDDSDSPKIASDIEVDRGEGGATVSVSNATQGARGKVRCKPSGACTYTPNTDFNGGDEFTITARDNEGATGRGTITVAIAPVADDPKANDDPAEGETLDVDRDTPLENIDVLDNDTDADGDTLSIHSVGEEDSDGDVAINPDGTLTFTPNPGFFGTTTFTYRAMDFRATSATEADDDASDGISKAATVTITVNDVGNTAPDAEDDAYSVGEGETLTADGMGANPNGVLFNDTDSDNDDLTASLIAGPSEDSDFTLGADGTFTYTPDDPDFFGIDEFTYVADDGRGTGNLSEEMTVTITVNNEEDNPVANDDPENDDAYTVNEDGTLTVNAANGLIANDTDADNLTGSANAGLTVADSGAASGIQPATAPAHGTLTLNANGSFTYAPNANYNGPDSFTYRAKDAEGNLSDTAATVSISVSPVADAPVARLDNNVEVIEDTPKAIDVLANDGNPDGGPLTLEVVAEPDHGTASVITEDGADKNKIRYTPNLHFHGADRFTYEVCDAGNRCDQAEVRITVTPVNDNPVAVNDSYDADDDETLSVNAADGLLKNDTDVDNADGGNAGLTVADGDTESGNGISPVTAPTKGSLILNASGSFGYTPNANVSGTDSFTYRAKDVAGAESNEATVEITINAANRKPVANADTADADEDGGPIIIDVLANDTDADNVSPPANAGLDISDFDSVSEEGGSIAISEQGVRLTYTPAADFNGTDTFTYTATDNGAKNAASDPATVTVTVAPKNDAPNADSATRTTDEDGDNVAIDLSTLVFDVETDNEDLTFGLADSPPSGATLSGSTLTYDPADDFNTGGGNPVEIEYSVTDRGDPDDCGTADDDCDGAAESRDTISVTVRPVNDRPTAADFPNVATDEDTPKDIDVLAEAADADGDPLTIFLPSDRRPSHGTVSIVENIGSQGSDTVLRYTPNPNYNGPDSFQYRVDDGELQSPLATVSITVASVNDRPVAKNDTAVTNEDTPVAIDVLRNDADADGGDELTISAFDAEVKDSQNNVIGTVENVNGVLVFTPADNFNGTATFSYTVTDGSTGETATATATVTVNVRAINDPPTAEDDTYVVDEDAVLTADGANPNPKGVLFNDEDVDGDALTAQLVGNVSHGALVFNASDGTFTYTPNAHYNGADAFTYRAKDPGNARSDVTTVAITVNAVNDTPIAVADTKSTAKNAPITFAASTLTANDKPAPDGAADERNQTLTVTAVESGEGGSVELTEGGITFTPASNFKGAASFEYTVCDNGTPDPACATATVTVNVAASNAAPAAAPITRSMAEDATPISINLFEAGNVSDNETADGDLTFAIADGPAPNEGVATLAGPTLTFDSAPNFHGPVEMAYSVTDDGDDDAALQTTEADLTINVTPVNDRPTAGNVSFTAREDTVSNINVLAAAADVDGDDLEVEIVRQPGKASATVNANGTVRYAPRLNLNGPDTFTYRVSDGALESAAATVNVSITAVNDAPVARNDVARTLVNRAVNINVLANDTDADGDALTATLLRRPAIGTVTRNANGTFRYTPPRNFVGRPSFTYRVSDGKGGTSVATVRISVTRR